MNRFLKIREQLRTLYATYGTYIMPVIKILTVLFSLTILNNTIGALRILRNPLIVAIISGLAGFMPVALITFMLICVIIAHIMAISVELGGFVLAVILIMYLFFFRFTPKDSVLIILLPILFYLGIPYAVPVIVGLVAQPVSVVSVAFGIVLYYILLYVGVNMQMLVSATSEDGFSNMMNMATDIFGQPEVYITIAAFAMVVVTVYMVKRMSIDYSWLIAAITGGVLCIIVMLIGVLCFDLSGTISVLSVLLGGGISILISVAAYYYIHAVDYTRIEYTQFEDDDFYYYVKAVPKVKVSEADVNVTRINARKVRER